MSPARPHSLQARVQLFVIGLLVAVWLGAAALTWVDARDELDELLGGHLAQAAALLVVQQTHADGDDDVTAPYPGGRRRTCTCLWRRR